MGEEEELVDQSAVSFTEHKGGAMCSISFNVHTYSITHTQCVTMQSSICQYDLPL